MKKKDLVATLAEKFANIDNGIHGFGVGKKPKTIRVYRSRRISNALRKEIQTSAAPYALDFGEIEKRPSIH